MPYVFDAAAGQIFRVQCVVLPAQKAIRLAMILFLLPTAYFHERTTLCIVLGTFTYFGAPIK